MFDQLHEKKNLLKLTILSYGLTCLTGILVILPFVVTEQAAHYFHSHVAYIAFIFSFFMFGMMIAQFLNGYIIQKLSVQTEIYLSLAIYCICSAGLFLIHSTTVLAIILSIIGFCAGVIVTLPNFIIVHAFDDKARSIKLNRLDLFFSIGSLIYPMIAGWMLTHGFSWQSVYVSALIVFVFIAILCGKTILPDVSEHRIPGQTFSKWTPGVWLVGFAIFAYFMSYVGYTYWVSDDLHQYHHLSVTSADFGVSLFWILYAVGCLISSFAVQYIAVHKYIIFSAIVALLAYFLIDLTITTYSYYCAISLLGLGCATVYSSSISYGTQLIAHPSPRVVAYFITLSGIGTYLGQVYSSWIVAHWGIQYILLTSAAFMALAIVIYSIVAIKKRAR